MALLDELKLSDLGLQSRVEALLDAPAELLLPERLLLYALVRGLRPERCLEIGSHFGGSTTIIAGALDDVGGGVLVCVDPSPLGTARDLVTDRAPRHDGSRLLTGALVEARATVDGDFEFVFIDGDHTRAGVVCDVEGVLDFVAPGAHLLFHDSHYWEISAGIDDCVARHADRLVECGTLSTLSTEPIVAPDGKTARWGGFRMLRVAGSHVAGGR